MEKIYKSLEKCIHSFGYAFKGIIYAMRNENNFLYHLLATAVIGITGYLMRFTLMEWVFIILTLGIVYIAELFNSAIEKLVDLTAPRYHYKAGIIKDIAAGAVLVSAICALCVGLIIILRHV